MKLVVLIRHGHAEHVDGPITGGWTNTNLTELGVIQAKSLANRLKRDISQLDLKLYCSDLKRAEQTAAIIGQALNLDPITMSRPQGDE
jgi:probable phosphoglycerate mutase